MSSSPQWFKRAQRGLYAGKNRLVGYHVSPSKRHVKRSWVPNVQRKHLWSDILGRQIAMNVTTAALRIIDRKGGLDNYILETPPEKLNSEFGERIRKALFQEMLAAAKAAEGAQAAASGGSASSSVREAAPAADSKQMR